MNIEEQRQELRNFILENFEKLQLDEMGIRTAMILKHAPQKAKKLLPATMTAVSAAKQLSPTKKLSFYRLAR